MCTWILINASDCAMESQFACEKCRLCETAASFSRALSRRFDGTGQMRSQGSSSERPKRIAQIGCDRKIDLTHQSPVLRNRN
jgi:hypothetical protein